MINLSDEKFLFMAKSIEQKKIIATGPMYFYYENRGPKDIMGQVPCKEPFNENYNIKFGFHTGFDFGLNPKKDSSNLKHASPRIELERVVYPEKEFKVAYRKGGALISPEYDLPNNFSINQSPDKYFLYNPNEMNEFLGLVFGRLTELGLINDLIIELHTKKEKDKNITIGAGLNYLVNLMDNYIENKFFILKEYRNRI